MTASQDACRTRMLAAFDTIVDAVDDASWELGRLEEAQDGSHDDGDALHRGVHAARAVVRDAIGGERNPADVLIDAADAWERDDEQSAWPALLRGFAGGLAGARPVRGDEPFAQLDEAVRAAHDALRDADAAEELSEVVIGFADDYAARRESADVVAAWGHAAGVAEETAQESAAEHEGLPEPHAVAFAIIVGAVYDAINA